MFGCAGCLLGSACLIYVSKWRQRRLQRNVSDLPVADPAVSPRPQQTPPNFASPFLNDLSLGEQIPMDTVRRSTWDCPPPARLRYDSW